MSTPFEISDRYVEDLVQLSPEFATSIGVDADHGSWSHKGVAGYEDHRQLAEATRREMVDHISNRDLDQRTAAKVLVASLDHLIDAFDAGDHLEDISHLASTFRNLRTIFDTMDQKTEAGWSDIASRLEGLPTAFDQYAGRLEQGRLQGRVVAVRQVTSVIRQARALAGETSSYLPMVEKARSAGLSVDRLERATTIGRGAAAAFAEYLEKTYLPHATSRDAVGRERYLRRAARFLGMDVDLIEAYAWGWEELARLHDEMTRVGKQIDPDGDFTSVTRALERHPDLVADTEEAFRDFIGGRLSDAVEALDGTHFDVPAEIRPITVNVAPRGGALGAYYLRPSEDFTRPGSVWYSVGTQTTFPLYHQVSTAYHEGFPGHHLQIGTAMANVERLSRAHRLTVWYPGYGEGWAMYTERLMGELGYFERPEFMFGMLAKQMYRAARIVVDIGLHLEWTIPESALVAGGEPWTYDTAVSYMRTFGFRTEAQAHDEVLRYLGWPGQAISYKLGEREIMSLREDTRRRLGSDFDLKVFHREVIGNGAMGLSMLRDEVRERL